MSKHILDIDIECDFELYGIGTHIGSHRLAWELNRLFFWHLVYDRELECNNKGVPSHHIVHRYINKEEVINVALILNRVPNGTLAQGAASLDFLLKIEEGFPRDVDIISTIRKSNQVALVTSLNPVKSGALGAMFELD